MDNPDHLQFHHLPSPSPLLPSSSLPQRIMNHLDGKVDKLAVNKVGEGNIKESKVKEGKVKEGMVEQVLRKVKERKGKGNEMVGVERYDRALTYYSSSLHLLLHFLTSPRFHPP